MIASAPDLARSAVPQPKVEDVSHIAFVVGALVLSGPLVACHRLDASAFQDPQQGGRESVRDQVPF